MKAGGTRGAAAKRHGSTGKGRRVWAVVVTVAFVGVLFTTVFPTRTFLAQRASLDASTEKLGVLDEQNRLLEERARLLDDDAEIERLAREEYYLVRPGEEAYAVLPPQAATDEGAPPTDAGEDGNAVQRAWNWLTDLL